jgi:hypothetical protein
MHAWMGGTVCTHFRAHMRTCARARRAHLQARPLATPTPLRSWQQTHRSATQVRAKRANSMLQALPARGLDAERRQHVEAHKSDRHDASGRSNRKPAETCIAAALPLTITGPSGLGIVGWAARVIEGAMVASRTGGAWAANAAAARGAWCCECTCSSAWAALYPQRDLQHGEAGTERTGLGQQGLFLQ